MTVVIITTIALVLLLKLSSSSPSNAKSIFESEKKTKSKLLFVDNNITLRWNTTGITIAGITTGVSGSESNQLYSPWGLALTYENTLYIIDRRNHRVQKYSRENFSGNGTTVAGLGNSTPCILQQCLYYPAGIALDEAENMYISEESLHYVVLWKKNASLGQRIAGTGAITSFFCV